MSYILGMTFWGAKDELDALYIRTLWRHGVAEVALVLDQWYSHINHFNLGQRTKRISGQQGPNLEVLSAILYSISLRFQAFLHVSLFVRSTASRPPR